MSYGTSPPKSMIQHLLDVEVKAKKRERDTILSIVDDYESKIQKLKNDLSYLQSSVKMISCHYGSSKSEDMIVDDNEVDDEDSDDSDDSDSGDEDSDDSDHSDESEELESISIVANADCVDDGISVLPVVP